MMAGWPRQASSISPACRLCEKFATTKYGEHRLKMITALDDMLLLMDTKLYKFPSALQEKFSKKVHACLLHYGMMAKLAAERGCLRYSMVQKHHLTGHLSWFTESCHPRCFWTYGSESFMGHMVKIAQACVRGQSPKKAAESIVQKYRLSMHLILSGLMVLDEEDD